jgi:hypothetical protein
MPINPTDTFASDAYYLALARWRDAAQLVRVRWDAFLEAERPARLLLFASYVAALAAEEVAAAEIAAAR